MNVTKRSKRSRIRGRRGCGWGRRQKHRGKGSHGGKGMAGTGKRAGQKKTFVLKYFPNYFGKKGFKSIGQKNKKKLESINIEEIERKIDTFIKKGIAKKINDSFEVDLQHFKILGSGDTKLKLIIKAGAASEKAVQKIKAAGGDILTKQE